MKKIILLFLILPWLCSAQQSWKSLDIAAIAHRSMIQTDINLGLIEGPSLKPFVNQTFPGDRHDIEVETLHGSGEGGAADGSQFSKALGYGWAKMAREGYKFPFDLRVPQALPGPDYGLIFPSYGVVFQAKARLTTSVYSVSTASAIGAIGWSQGAEVLINQLSDPQCKLKCIVLIGAQKVPGAPDYLKMADIPVLCIAGSNDLAAVTTSSKLVTGLNANPDRKNRAEKPIIVPGADHSGSMRAAYDVNSATGKIVMAFMLKYLVTDKPEPKEEPAGVYLKGDSVIYYTPTGRRAVKL